MAKNKKHKRQARRARAQQAQAQAQALSQLMELRNKLHAYVFQPTRWSILKEFYSEQISLLGGVIETVRRDGAPRDFQEQFAQYCSNCAEIERELQ